MTVIPEEITEFRIRNDNEVNGWQKVNGNISDHQWALVDWIFYSTPPVWVCSVCKIQMSGWKHPVTGTTQWFLGSTAISCIDNQMVRSCG